jgi:Spy/CpxP family protein refolding chaperone
MRTKLITTLLGAALLVATPHAYAFGPGGGGGEGFRGHGGPGGPAGLPLRLLAADMTPDQRTQIRAILMANRAELRSILQELHAAHEALANKMFTPGALTASDVQAEEQAIAAAHQKLLDHGTKVMLAVRAVVTPDQLTKAAARKKQLDALHEQMRSILGGDPADDAPEDPAQ